MDPRRNDSVDRFSGSFYQNMDLATRSTGGQAHPPNISILNSALSRADLCYRNLPFLQPSRFIYHPISLICS
ncbi:hypothetical protein ACN38_g6627 [Penicillium nordicum]|uniref:Uncharacterized protein n=1 Tax=Penicillium nordicum TaxID=229535 RepID=A0A0M9WF48_9EURO|nr:hypothetical protein ACN38_g6627 [Penicillium nordicum]